MPDYSTRISNLENIVNNIIQLKRYWFSLDETNLEYRGLIAQLDLSSDISNASDILQSNLTRDYNNYLSLVKQNDNLWMDLAEIEEESDFRKTLNDYKTRRPYEELLSIDGASNKNLIDKKVLAQEIVQELVGMAFGRWDTAYAKGDKAIPEFGDIFDALPFMPVVSLDKDATNTVLQIPEDGILSNKANDICSLASKVRDVIHYICCLLYTSDAADE